MSLIKENTPHFSEESMKYMKSDVQKDLYLQVGGNNKSIYSSLSLIYWLCYFNLGFFSFQSTMPVLWWW